MSDPDGPQLVIRSVSVEGLEADAAATAEREVRGQFELARQFGMTLRQPAEVTVHVTKEVAAAVDRFNLEHGIPTPPYGRARPDGVSGGIVLTAPGDASPAMHTIVIDAALWSVQSDWHVVFRSHMLAYFVGHLVNRYDSDRTDPVAPEFNGVHAESLWRNSMALCSAWDDSAIAIDFCNASLRDLEGNSIRPSDHLGAGNLVAVSELLDQLCIFATVDVSLYRVFTIDLDGLYPTSMSLVGGLLRIVVGTIALYRADHRIEDLTRAFSAMNGYSEFLEPVWHDMLDGCISEEHDDRTRALSTAMTTLLHRLGLRIEDTEGGGLFVHVHEPVACLWEERTEEPA